MNSKVCKQCGELKPIEQFRKYYGGRKGTYTTCKLCEKINSRAKYLSAKGETATADEFAELTKIYTLYDVQRKAGLQPPRSNVGSKVPIADSLDDMIAKYSGRIVESDDIPDNTPAELLLWLTAELTEDPDYYLDEVYEELKTLYRPQIRIDTETMLPVHDDTYKVVLDKILERFNNYEDTYYNE